MSIDLKLALDWHAASPTQAKVLAKTWRRDSVRCIGVSEVVVDQQSRKQQAEVDQ